jgi:two-component system response regulator AtoC
VVQIDLPSLWERSEDIPILTEYFVDRYARQLKKRIKGLHPDAKAILCSYGWPGNIRELQNVIERAIIMTQDEGLIRPEDLPADLLKKRAERREPMRAARNGERESLLRMLQDCHWNRTLAAKRLGIARRTLYDRMARFRISTRPAV